jgi:hypothetical protein
MKLVSLNKEMSENSEAGRSMKTKTFNKKEWRRQKYSNKYKGKMYIIVSKQGLILFSSPII